MVEVAVVGGGAGGLSAALAAAKAGAQVTLLDAYPALGGQYYRQPPGRLGVSLSQRQEDGRRLAEQVRAAGVQVKQDASVWDIQRVGENWRLAVSGVLGSEVIEASGVILATGAYERPAVFPGWTLPGVITSGAAQILLYQQVRPGERVLVVGTGPLQLVTAAALVEAGVKVVAVLEGSALLARMRRAGLGRVAGLWGQWERLREGAHSLYTLARQGVPFRLGWGIRAAHGKDAVEGATIGRLDECWQFIAGSEQKLEVDTICVGYGLTPFNALSRLAGADQIWRPEVGGEVPWRNENLRTSQPGLFAVGDGAGIGGYRMARLEGQLAGNAAAELLGYSAAKTGKLLANLRLELKRERRFQRLYAALFTPGAGMYQLAAPDTWVCRCEGVTQERLEAAVRAGAGSIGEVKALTRCGMGECQGRICGMHVMHTLARLTGKPPHEIGLYNPRPPLFAQALGAFIPKDGVE